MCSQLRPSTFSIFAPPVSPFHGVPARNEPKLAAPP
jgi:hypothetical protein